MSLKDLIYNSLTEDWRTSDEICRSIEIQENYQTKATNMTEKNTTWTYVGRCKPLKDVIYSPTDTDDKEMVKKVIDYYINEDETSFTNN